MLTRKWYSVKKKNHPNEKIQEIKTMLTVKPFMPKGFGPQPESFPVYKENDEKLFLPRHFGIEYFGTPKKITISDGDSINVEFLGNLRDMQKPIVESIEKEMKKNRHCIMHVGTGVGKTAMSLNIATRFKQKTLILVHQDFLLNQWIERIQQFIPDARIGIIKQNRIEVDDKDIVIGMIQSICSRKYGSEIFKHFGLTIIDEVHNYSAQYFSQVLYSCGSKYMLGLSATPQRKDGLTKVLKWHLGNILSFSKQDIQYKVTVKCLRFIPKVNEIEVKKNFYGGVNVANLINQICNHKERNNMIIKELIMYGRLGRQILVLSDRVQHLKDLKEQIPDDISTGLYIGGMKQEERKISESKTIIFGTFVLVKEAVDIPSLNTLFLTTSKSDIVQAVGRILRKQHPKFNPLIIDIIDEISLFENQAKKRKTFYQKQGYSINDSQEIRVNNVISNDCLLD